VKFEESTPIIEDPIFRAYLTRDLTFSETISSGLTQSWHNYSSKIFPSSREEDSVNLGLQEGIKSNSLQLSFLFSNLGNIF
jgi:hypothetical protein